MLHRITVTLLLGISGILWYRCSIAFYHGRYICIPCRSGSCQYPGRFSVFHQNKRLSLDPVDHTIAWLWFPIPPRFPLPRSHWCLTSNVHTYIKWISWTSPGDFPYRNLLTLHRSSVCTDKFHNHRTPPEDIQDNRLAFQKIQKLDCGGCCSNHYLHPELEYHTFQSQCHC